MASPELTELIELYEENEYNPEKRIEACQKMWDLRDPEAILALKIIYEEDPQELVRAEAKDVLSKFKGLEREQQRAAAAAQQEDKKKKPRNWVPLQTLLILSLTVFLVLNGLYFVAEYTAADPTATPAPTMPPNPNQLRTQLLNRIEAHLMSITTYTEGLREQLIAVQGGGPVLNACQYRRQVARPQAFQLNPAEEQLRGTYYMDDIITFVENPDGDIAFAMVGLDAAADFYEVDLCSNPNPPQETLNLIPENIGRLDTVLDIVRIAQNDLQNYQNVIVPTFTPEVLPTQPAANSQ